MTPSAPAQAAYEQRLLKMEKVGLAFFTVRHLIGVAIVFTLSLQALGLPEKTMGLSLCLFGMAYAGFALFSWQKLRRQYQRRVARVQGLQQRQAQGS